jgi:hypothetical protein
MAKDGRVDWRWRTGGDVVGLPAPTNTMYFVALDNVLRSRSQERRATVDAAVAD